MAIITGTLKDAFSFQTPTGFNIDSSTPAQQAMVCYVTASFSGTYDTAAHAQLTGLDTFISGIRRNGKTVTILDVTGAGSGLYGATPTPMAGFVTSVTGGTVALNLTQGNLSTEFGNGGTVGPETTPIPFGVFFKEV